MTRERVRYFTGQLLGAEDFDQEQRYFREKARRHNRLLHGWGVVDGLEVHAGPGACEVTIEPGYALDPTGEEIVVEDEAVLDLAAEPPGQPLYVAVRYAECPVRPVPAPAGGDGTEYSRTRESFAVAALTSPESPEQAWVVLAEATLGPGPALSSVQPGSHRRRVAVGPA